MCSPDSRTVTCVRSIPVAFAMSICVFKPALAFNEKYFFKKVWTLFSSRPRSLRYSGSSAVSLSSHSSMLCVGSSIGSFRTISSSVRRMFWRSSGSFSRLYSKQSSTMAEIRSFSSGELSEDFTFRPILIRPALSPLRCSSTDLPNEFSATISRISILKGSRFYDFFPLFPTFHHFVTPFSHLFSVDECDSIRLLQVRRLDLEERDLRGRLWREWIA